ncbi:MAG TPA: glycosyltransferase family 2 protein [Flavisolibacter sp.]|nr:glycosyltransferase family 2 protein [Flavisolibacter sp.]
MQQGLSVVIPNYNGISLFPHTLPSVFSAVSSLSIPYEVIVADDCSTDASVEWLRLHYPQIRLVTNDQNSGFSVTANRGIEAARYRLVLLLNSDVKLEPGYFESQFRYFEDPGVFGVMGRIIGWEDDNIQDGAKYPSFHSAKIKTSVNYLLANEKDMEHGLLSMYLSGANALMDREKFLRLGGFNELFSPFYVEDYELSLRAWRAGWKCIYEYKAVCRHRTSTSIKTKSRKAFIKKIAIRNKMFLHAIHLSSFKRLLWFTQLVLEVLVQTLLFKTYYTKAFWLFLRSMKSVRSSRKAFNTIAGSSSPLSVKDVADKIQSSVEGKVVRFF